MTAIRPLLIVGALTASGWVLGCARPGPNIVATKPPEVIVDKPVVKTVTDYEDFTGRTRASRSVDLKTQVTGELLDQWFEDGAEVTAGQLLFTLDPTIFQAEVDHTRAALRQAEVRLRQPEKKFFRLEAITKQSGNTISADEYDLAKSSYEEALSAVTVAQRQLDTARNFVDYTLIYAPFSGRIGRRFVDPGNRIKQDETVLARLVKLDPMDVEFDVDDRTLLRLQSMMLTNKLATASVAGGWRYLGGLRDQMSKTVQIGLPDKESLTLEGRITFIDNQLNTSTSTIQVRAEVPNPRMALDAGLFVRVRIPVGDPHTAVLVPEECIGTDQQLKFVYVVNANDEVEYRKVKLGQQDGSLRVVEPVPDDPKSGVKPDDRVIVIGIQRAKPGAKVTVKPRQLGQ